MAGSMSPEELGNHCAEVARLASKNKGYYGNLVFPQRRGQRAVIREPEIRDIFGRYMMLEMVLYGIEVPTKNKYQFSGKTTEVAARTDLAIFDSFETAARNEPIINIEFKEGQPTPQQIKKDWQKLLREPVDGTCFYHVLQSARQNTVPALTKKLASSYDEAVGDTIDVIDKWHLFFAVIIESQVYYRVIFPSILSISFDQLRQAEPTPL